jgi:hypothetical protein
VVDRAQLQGDLHFPPGSFDIEQLLVAQGDVSAHGVGSEQRSRWLPSSFASAPTALTSRRGSPARGDAQCERETRSVNIDATRPVIVAAAAFTV